MLEEMLFELDRLIAKYSQPEWSIKATARRLVDILVEHQALVQTELSEVNLGTRQLQDSDFLGPLERSRRNGLRGDGGRGSSADPKGGKGVSYFRRPEQTCRQDKLDVARIFLDMRNRGADAVSHEEVMKAFHALEKLRRWEAGRRPSSNYMPEEQCKWRTHCAAAKYRLNSNCIDLPE